MRVVDGELEMKKSIRSGQITGSRGIDTFTKCILKLHLRKGMIPRVESIIHLVTGAWDIHRVQSILPPSIALEVLKIFLSSEKIEVQTNYYGSRSVTRKNIKAPRREFKCVEPADNVEEYMEVEGAK